MYGNLLNTFFLGASLLNLKVWIVILYNLIIYYDYVVDRLVIRLCIYHENFLHFCFNFFIPVRKYIYIYAKILSHT